MESSSEPVKINSRKRKRRDELPNPLYGILTRSKSKIYLTHPNRSGIARRDALPMEPKIEPLEDHFLEVNRNDVSQVSSVKDLRARRVFTPDVVNSVLEEEEEEEEEQQELNVVKGNHILDSDLGNNNHLNVNHCVALPEAEGDRRDKGNGVNLKDQPISGNGSISKSKTALHMARQRKVFKTPSSPAYRRLLPYLMDILNDNSEIVDARIPHKLQKLDGSNAEVSPSPKNPCTDVVENVVPNSDHKNPLENDGQKLHTSMPCNQQDLCSAKNELDQRMENILVEYKTHENDASGIHTLVEEECCQTTPPDANIFIKELGNGGQTIEANNENQSRMELSVGIERTNNAGKLGTNFVKRSVLNPCSRLKVFKNPNSLGYRRLFPILMEMSKHNSCASKIIEHPKPQLDLKDDKNSLLSGTAEQDYMNKTRTDKFNVNQQIGDQGQDLLSSLDPLPSTDGLSNPATDPNPDSSLAHTPSTNFSSIIEPPSVSSQTNPEPFMLLDFKPEEKTQPQCSPGKLELNRALIMPSTSNCEISTNQSTSNESGPVAIPKKGLNKGLEVNDNSICSIGTVDSTHSPFQIEVSNALVIPGNGSFKGILKKNPRGCRGLCSCLNCASFRLHADRAFEFSRNQMSDAEEITLELMKELASLRRMLENTCVNEIDPSVIQLNLVQVKQACNRALETENIAKERLTKLNYDLNIHCRIPYDLLRPNVTFANHCQEKAIPMLDPSKKRG